VPEFLDTQLLNTISGSRHLPEIWIGGRPAGCPKNRSIYNTKRTIAEPVVTFGPLGTVPTRGSYGAMTVFRTEPGASESAETAGAPAVMPDGAGTAVPRRSALKGIGVGAATMVVAGTGVLSYRVFDNGVLDAGSGRPYDAWSHWRDDPGPLGTVAAAILAANPHNSQPWFFHVTASRVEMFADPSRRTGTLDSLGREQHIGLGCAIENLVLAAAARGYRPAVTLLPRPAEPAYVASIALAPGPVNAGALYDAIGSRHSNRGPYTTAAVPSAAIDSLGAQAAGLDGVGVRWFTTEAQRAAVGALMIEAAQAITADGQQSRDAFAWFRNNRDDINTRMDGLTLDGQGLAPLTLSLAKILPAESRAAGDKFWVDQTRAVHTKTAAAYGVITVADTSDPVLRLTGGRFLERIHLAATAAGLGLQHMNQITERIDRERALGRPATFAPAFDALIAQPGQFPLAAFRIGYPVRSARLSPRRPLKDVIR